MLSRRLVGSVTVAIGLTLVAAACSADGDEATIQGVAVDPAADGTVAGAGDEDVAAPETESSLASGAEASGASDADDAENPSSVGVLSGPPAIIEWRLLMESLLGPTPSIGQPFLTAVGYFPEDLPTPEDAGLVFQRGSMSITEDADSVFAKPGLDTIRLSGVYTSSSSFDDLRTWFDDTYATNNDWEIDGSELREEDSGRVMVYRFIRPGGDPGLMNWTLAILEEDGGTSSVQFGLDERDVQTLAPFEQLSELARSLPRPLDEFPHTYDVKVDDLAVGLNSRWELRDVTAEEVAMDIVGQLPFEGFELNTAPIYDGSTDIQLDMVCADTLSCTLRVTQLENSDESIAVIWNHSYLLSTN